MVFETCLLSYNDKYKNKEIVDIPSGFGLHSHCKHEPFLGGRNPYGQSFLH